jgi:hypothetical protein
MRVGPVFALPQQISQARLNDRVVDGVERLTPLLDVIRINVLDGRRKAPPLTCEHRAERASGALSLALVDRSWSA